MLYAVKWEIKADFIMNIVRLTGNPVNNNQKQGYPNMLLQSALETIFIAELYQGKLLSCEPPKKSGEFVYFEVIFKNSTECRSFLSALKNEFS